MCYVCLGLSCLICGVFTFAFEFVCLIPFDFGLFACD